MKWKNRIIETGIANPSELIANPVNFRKHPKRQQEAINGSLDALGWIQNVIVNKRTGRIIDGHLRVDQAIAHGEAAVPVQWVDLSEEEEGQALLSLDPIAAMAETNKQSMTDILKQINATQDALAPYLEEIAKSSGIDIGDILGKDEDDPPEESEAESFRVKWGVESGQMWELGEHRVLCGDCTDKLFSEMLMDGLKANLVITDPPYGVSYSDKNTFLNAIDKGNRIQTEIENDHLSKEETKILWKKAFNVMNQVMDNGATVYCFMPQGGDQMMMMMMLDGAGIEPKHELIWLKNNHVLGRVDYAYKHEPILYAWKNTGHKFYGGFQTSIIECNRPTKSKFHPTMKPVELIERLISNSSLQNQIIYDPFLGSGTTLIACENLHRKCRGIEISPEYVAVTIERWNRLTGKIPTLISTL